MKTIKILTLGVLAAASLTMGCKEKMIELNTDPGIVGTTNTEYMLLGSLGGWGKWGRDWPVARGNMMQSMQYSTRTVGDNPFVDPETRTGGGAYNGYGYSQFYDRGLKLHSLVKHIDEMAEVTDREKYSEMRAIAATMEAYLAWQVFDMYGAMVYTEAFQAREGLLRPSYDLYQEKYKTLDSVIKAQVNYFTTPATSITMSAGQYDLMYGYKMDVLENGGCNITKLDNASLQRQRWAKFANVFRMKMAMRLQAKDYTHYSAVMKEVLASPAGLMAEVADGMEFIYNKGTWADAVDGCQYGQYHQNSLAFINTMKITDDPRMPLYARPAENDTSLSTSYNFIYTHFPDSIAKYNGVLDLGNVWQGKTINPDNKNLQFGPDKITLTATMQFKIKNTNFNVDEPESHPLLSPTTGKPIIWGKDTTVSWRMLSGVPNRYWLINAGSSDDPNDQYSAMDKNELPRVSNDLVSLTVPVLTYSEQCFSLALIAATDPAYAGAIAGKSTSEWYNEGVRVAIMKQQDDARRVYIRICTYENFPLIVGVNGTTMADKHLYAVTPAMVNDYIEHPLVKMNAQVGEPAVKLIGEQMWLSMYMDPDNAWGYWKLTGYPTSQIIAYENPTLPTTIAWEQPTKGAIKLLVARRVDLGAPNNFNIDKWYEVQAKLIKQTNPDFGPWSNMAGRIWWDVNPVK